MHRKNMLEVDETAACTVRDIYRLYLEGYGYSSIARYLDAMNYKPPSSLHGHNENNWNPVTIKRILANRVYIGDTVQGVSEKISFKSKKTRRLPAEQWKITQATHMPIIDPVTFERVQSLLPARRKAVYTQSETHPLHGLIYCGSCGSTMIARRRKGRPMAYICGRYGKYGANACTSHHIREKDILECIAEDMEAFLTDKVRMKHLTAILHEQAGEQPFGRNSIQTLESQLGKHSKQMEVLYKDRLEGVISKELYTKISHEISSEMDRIIEQLNQIRKGYQTQADMKYGFDWLIEALRNESVSNSTLRKVITKITVYDSSDSLENMGSDMAGREGCISHILQIKNPMEEPYDLQQPEKKIIIKYNAS